MWNLCARRAHASFEFSRSGIIFQSVHAEPDAANHPPGAQERSPEAEPGMEPRSGTLERSQEWNPGAKPRGRTRNGTQERSLMETKVLSEPPPRRRLAGAGGTWGKGSSGHFLGHFLGSDAELENIIAENVHSFLCLLSFQEGTDSRSLFDFHFQRAGPLACPPARGPDWTGVPGSNQSSC